MVFIGKGIKPEKATKWEADARQHLVDGEELLMITKAVSFRPMIDVAAFTSLRVIGFSSDGHLTIKADVPRASVVESGVRKGMNGKYYESKLVSGSEFNFKFHFGEDLGAIQEVLDQIRTMPVDPVAAEIYAQRATLKEAASSPEQKAIAKEEKREAKAAVKEQRVAVQTAREAQELEDFGHEIQSGSFGGKTVQIFSKGYVRVSTMFGSDGHQKLLSIEDSSNVQKKSALGRTAGGVFTLGMSVALSPNKRGDLFLVIVTDKRTYTLTQDPPTAGGMKSSKALAAAGRAVLSTLEREHESQQTPVESQASSGDASPASKLREAAALHQDGILTDDEFAEIKARLLGQI